MHLRIILLFYRSVSVHPESHKPFHMLQQLSPHDIPAVQIPNLPQTGYMLFFPVVLFFSMFHCQMWYISLQPVQPCNSYHSLQTMRNMAIHLSLIHI